MDESQVSELGGKVLGDLGGAVSVPLVRIGDALGLCRVLAEIGPSVEEVAAASGCAPRYLREWLSAQASSGYVTHAAERLSLSPAQALAFAAAQHGAGGEVIPQAGTGAGASQAVKSALARSV